MPQTISSINYKSQPAVNPPSSVYSQTSRSKSKATGSRKLSNPTLSNRFSHIPKSKYINVNLNSPKKTSENLRNLKAHESLKIYYKTGSVREPIHAPNRFKDYTNTLTSESLRKHNLRHNRSISNESLVGGIIKGQNLSISNISSSIN